MKTIMKIIVCGLFFLPLWGYGQTVTVTPQQVQVLAETGTTNVNVYSDTYWGIYGYDEWITPDTNWYNGNKTLSFIIEENPFMATRTETCTVYCMDANFQYFSDVPLTITQAPNSWGIADTSFQIGAEEGSPATMLITTEYEWEIVAISSWLTADVQHWKGTTNIVFTAMENNQSTTRKGSVSIALERADGSYITGTVSVYQDASDNGISSSNLTFTAQQGSMQSISIVTNEQWNVVSLPSWLLASPMNGSGTSNIAFIAMANNVVQNRNAEIIIRTSSGKEFTITVHQEGATPQFTLNSSSTQFGSAANSSISVSVHSNTYWGITQIPAWINNTDMFSYLDSSFSLTVQQNPFTIARKAAILAYYMDGNGMYANGEKHIFTQSASSTGISDTTIYINGAQGSTSQFTVNYGSRWQIDANSDWLQVNPNGATGTRTVTVTANENPYTTQREGFIEVRLQLSQSNWLTGTIKVIQQGSSSGVSEDILTVIATQSTNQIQITTDKSWSINGMDSWIQVSPQSGSGSRTVSITTGANENLYYRGDTLQISFNGGAIVPLVIIQDPAKEKLVFTPDNIVFEATEGSSVNISVSSNTNWGFIEFPDWIISSEKYGYANDAFQLSAHENTSALSRTDSITIYWFDIYEVYHSKKVAVRQKGNMAVTLQTIQLQEGWNLFSINYELTDTRIEYALSALWQNILEIKDFQSYYRNDQPAFLNNLTNIEPGNGYLIKLKAPQTVYNTGATLMISESQFLSSIQNGWNLIGVPFNESKDIFSLFNQGNYSVIKDFDAFYDFENQTGTLNKLEPGGAYMIKKK